MRKVTVHIESVTPYSQSRQHDAPKLNKESADAYEIRTWREKANYDESGVIYIPAMALKQALDSAAKKLSEQIVGKGKKTYTAYFVQDVLCDGNVSLGVHKDDVDGVTINANAKGIRGPGARVKRTFPVVPSWSAKADFVVLDDTVTPEVFERTFAIAGMGIGIGRFRPQNGGLNGRFRAVKFVWQQI